MKSSWPSLCVTLDKQLLLCRDPDRSWCHRHTTSKIKLFWSQPMPLWASAAAWVPTQWPLVLSFTSVMAQVENFSSCLHRNTNCQNVSTFKVLINWLLANCCSSIKTIFSYSYFHVNNVNYKVPDCFDSVPKTIVHSCKVVWYGDLPTSQIEPKMKNAILNTQCEEVCS